MNNGLPIKARQYVQFVSALTAFLVIYFLTGSTEIRQISLYILILIGLWFGQWFNASVIVTGFVGIGLLMVSGLQDWHFPQWSLSVVLLGLMPVPYYFSRQNRMAQAIALQSSTRHNDRLKELTEYVEEYSHHRESLRQEIENMNQLYILGRDLVEHTDMTDVFEHIAKAFLKRSGVSGIAVLLWVNQGWSCVYCFPRDEKSVWTEFMKKKYDLSRERRFHILDGPLWLREKAVVFWPVRFEQSPLAAILLTTTPEVAPRYVEEGTIFVPQVALGLKRMQLFWEVQERSRTDGLTGLFLRRYFLERLSTELQRSARYASEFSLCMIDIDYFKQVNDSYGHLVGDRVLCILARIFVNCTPPGGLICRYGGEEFVVMIPGASRSEAVRVAQEIQRVLALKNLGNDLTELQVTVSIGISHFPGDGESSEVLIAAADKAMYWVKQNGRNGIHEFQRLT